MNRHIALTTALRVVWASVKSSARHSRVIRSTRCGDISCPWRSTSSRIPRRSLSSAIRAAKAAPGSGNDGIGRHDLAAELGERADRLGHDPRDLGVDRDAARGRR